MTGATGGTTGVGTGGSTATAGSGVGTAGSNVGQGGGGTQVVSCQPTDPRVIRAPMRRLTRQEYNNTARDILKDASFPANSLPPEEIGNGFGNDADAQEVFATLIEEYANVAEKIATTATSSANIGKLGDCATQAKDATAQTACAKTIAESLAPKLWRRPLAAGESDGLVALYTTVRQANDFASGIGAMLEAMLQSPEYLYKPEFGVPIAGRTDVTRPTDYEMATRLASLLWASSPDDDLRTAAAMGQLSTADGILTQAKRLLADPKAKDVTKFFFAKLLPIESLAALERDAAQYPTFSTKIGSLMRTETETFLENEVFSPEGSGTWPGALTAKYTYVNKDLAAFYGISGVTSDTFVKVPLDPATTHRGGLLTQAGILAGPIHTNSPNPVVRGSFIVQKLLCQTIPKPTGQIAAMVTLPDPKSAATARQRYSTHSTNPVCHACHVNMDPYGFALENFDPVGLWRDQEGGVTIDASGDSPQLGKFNGVLELEKAMAASEQAQNCFAAHWTNFGYGRTITQQEACAVESVRTKFKESGYNIQQLLLALTQSEAFLNLPAVRE